MPLLSEQKKQQTGISSLKFKQVDTLSYFKVSPFAGFVFCALR